MRSEAMNFSKEFNWFISKSELLILNELIFSMKVLTSVSKLKQISTSWKRICSLSARSSPRFFSLIYWFVLFNRIAYKVGLFSLMLSNLVLMIKSEIYSLKCEIVFIGLPRKIKYNRDSVYLYILNLWYLSLVLFSLI